MTDTTRPTYDELAEALHQVTSALDNVLLHYAGRLTVADATSRRALYDKAVALLARIEAAPAPRIAEALPYIRTLHAAGYYVGVRDPNRNRAFLGDYMVAQDLEEGPTDDAGSGGYCVVGHDLFALAVDACCFLGLDASTTTDRMLPVKRCCKHCGSTDVLMDADASWDVATQTWVLNAVNGPAYCKACEGETTVRAEPV